MNHLKCLVLFFLVALPLVGCDDFSEGDLPTDEFSEEVTEDDPPITKELVNSILSKEVLTPEDVAMLQRAGAATSEEDPRTDPWDKCRARFFRYRIQFKDDNPPKRFNLYPWHYFPCDSYGNYLATYVNEIRSDGNEYPLCDNYDSRDTIRGDTTHDLGRLLSLRGQRHQELVQHHRSRGVQGDWPVARRDNRAGEKKPTGCWRYHGQQRRNRPHPRPDAEIRPRGRADIAARRDRRG